MTTTKLNNPSRDWAATLNSNLGQCVGEKTLLGLVLDAVQTVELPPFTLEPGREYRPQMLLTLLTYSYATGRYASRDIEWALGKDRSIRYICAHHYPDWRVLRQFRRRSRELLQRCLVYVLKQTWALKFDQGEADYVGYEWFESDLVQQMERAAIDRIDLAAWLDGVEGDL